MEEEAPYGEQNMGEKEKLIECGLLMKGQMMGVRDAFNRQTLRK